MSELVLVVALRAKPGKEDALRRDLAAVVEPSRKEDGGLRYDLYVDQNEPGRFVFVEHWASREQRDKHHNEGPHIQHFGPWRGECRADGVCLLPRPRRLTA
ncbi:hypothetical protein BTHI11S_00193 [Bosea thiooxidans]